MIVLNQNGQVDVTEGDGKKFKWFWERPDEDCGADKNDHAERSRFHSPVHEQHWKKSKESKDEEYDWLQGYEPVVNPETGEVIQNPMYIADITPTMEYQSEPEEVPEVEETEGVSEQDEASWNQTDASSNWSPQDE